MLTDANAVNAERGNTDVIQIEDNTILVREDKGHEFEQTETSGKIRYKEVPLEDRRQNLYAEQNINTNGGTIYLGDASLYIPPGALSESRVIGLSVMNEHDFRLSKEVEKDRITPVIKVEPLGLLFKKPLTLTIRHSALIFEPGNHGVTVYTGQPPSSTEDIPGKQRTRKIY